MLIAIATTYHGYHGYRCLRHYKIITDAPLTLPLPLRQPLLAAAIAAIYASRI